MFKIACGKLKLDLDTWDTYTIADILMLYEVHQEDQKDYFEGIQRAVAFAQASVNKGKWQPMYKKESTKKKVSDEQFNTDMDYIKNKFGRSL